MSHAQLCVSCAQGPGLLNEFIQNADDAGATRVGIMLNLDEYGCGSLLSPRLEAWQGPALYFYNDAVFCAC
jgi:hypothetical protein